MGDQVSESMNVNEKVKIRYIWCLKCVRIGLKGRDIVREWKLDEYWYLGCKDRIERKAERVIFKFKSKNVEYVKVSSSFYFFICFFIYFKLDESF